MEEEKLKFAVFIDFDNIEIGVKSTLSREFDVALVLEALKERGEVVTKFAYGNWKMAGRHSEKMAAHAVQMIQRDPSPRGDKNGGDINLAMDALEMAFTRDFINAFAIVGGDSDFLSLVEKLKQYNKAVYIVGGRGFTSTILQKNCKEFISYENLIGATAEGPVVAPETLRRPRGRRGTVRKPSASASASAAAKAAAQAAPPPPAPPRDREDGLPLSNVLPLLTRALKVLADREHEPLLGLVKSTMMQLDSTFTERDYGVSSFLDFAEKLAHAGMLHLERRNGNYLVSLPSGELPGAHPPSEESREEQALTVLSEVLQEAAQRGRREFHIHGLKQFVSKLRPGFDERKFGFKQFSALLNLAHDRGLVSIAPDERGAMRVRTVIQEDLEQPVEATMPSEEPETDGEAEAEVEASAKPAYQAPHPPVSATVSSEISAPAEELTEPKVPDTDSFLLAPPPAEEEGGPGVRKRRRKAPAVGGAAPKRAAKPRAPRKKKAPEE